MKILIINRSSRVNGNTSIAIDEMAETFRAESVEIDIMQDGNKDVCRTIMCQGKYRILQKSWILLNA